MERFEAFIARALGENWLIYIPFVSLALQREMPKNPIITRLIELAVVGVIGSAISVWMAVPIIQKDIQHLDYNVKQLDQKVEKYHDSVSRQIDRLQGDIYIPRGGVGGAMKKPIPQAPIGVWPNREGEVFNG